MRRPIFENILSGHVPLTCPQKRSPKLIFLAHHYIVRVGQGEGGLTIMIERWMALRVAAVEGFFIMLVRAHESKLFWIKNIVTLIF